MTTIGSLGDLHPMMALAFELKKRGHLTTIVTTEFYRSKIEEAGLRFRPIRPNMSPEEPGLLAKVMDLKKGPEFIIREIFMPNLRDMYEDLKAAAADADFIVSGELVFATSILAEQKNIRWAMAVLQPTSLMSSYDPSVIAPLPVTKYLHNAPVLFHKLLFKIGQLVGRSWVKPIAELRAELGLKEVDDPLFRDKFSPHLNLVMFSKLIGTPQPDWPRLSVQTGFAFYDRDANGQSNPRDVDRFIDGGEPPIIFTLGSAAVRDAGDFYEESIKAAISMNKRAMLLVGDNLIKQKLPESIAAFEYAPFSEIFPRAACVVHQGGIGTTAQVLRAGVPQLVMPYGLDQPDNAARVVRLGVARSIPRKKYSAALAEKALT
ncbi:MAG: glycosyltransferase family 1 protein, partial [Acidobacteria bacterium]|nr:glycosyltransferase family 1 protein [Acidobacteriota bacterium]